MKSIHCSQSEDNNHHNDFPYFFEQLMLKSNTVAILKRDLSSDYGYMHYAAEKNMHHAAKI